MTGFGKKLLWIIPLLVVGCSTKVSRVQSDSTIDLTGKWNDTDSRLVAEGNNVRRRRECITCAERFTTYEAAELVMPRIIKAGGIREPFNEDKMTAGLMKALEKRPVSIERVEEAVTKIKASLRSTGEREIDSRTVGELVMSQLRDLDEDGPAVLQ